jgi:tRNA nucleotidyltransferase (CCA-adding enzyme)
VTERVVNLIRHHMVDYDPAWGDGAVRRFIRRVGPDNVNLLLSFRKADIMAHGTRGKGIDLISGLEKKVGDLMKKDFIRDTRDLAVDGKAVMDILGLSPGPDVGRVLRILMEKVTDNPEMNTEKELRAILKEMGEKGMLPFCLKG